MIGILTRQSIAGFLKTVAITNADDLTINNLTSRASIDRTGEGNNKKYRERTAAVDARGLHKFLTPPTTLTLLRLLPFTRSLKIVRVWPPSSVLTPFWCPFYTSLLRVLAR